MTKPQTLKIATILNNIRSSENVGSIFRTADAFGVEKIFLVGITPCPLDRFGRINNKIAKSALGAEKSISWQQISNLSVIVKDLKKEGYKIIGVEQSPQSIDYRKIINSVFFSSYSKIVFVFGNEVDGLSKEDLMLCDYVLEIPMQGKKESLNVSVCTGIILAATDNL